MTILTKTEIDAQNFLRYAFGETPVGSADGESVDRAYSPELRAFFQGRIGGIPSKWWLLQENQLTPQERAARKAVAEFLIEIAGVLDPHAGATEE